MLFIFLKSKFFVLAFFCLFTINCFAQNNRIQILPHPNWIKEINTDNNNYNPKEISNGYFLSLLDVQTHAVKKSYFVHQIIHIVSETGVQNASEISVNFDPSFEQLFFHKIQIKRNGQVINKLDVSRFKIIQNETELSRFLYNETFTALLILDDVQKGDDIDFEYTLVGQNPIFEDKIYSDYYFSSHNPIYHLHRSLILPKSREVIFKSFNNPPESKISIENGFKYYEWDSFNLKSPPPEDYTPSWWDDLPHIQISEAKSWNEIALWASKLNKVNNNLSPALIKKINDLKNQTQNNKKLYLQLATRFVQDEIRYMGIEIGENSHKPHHPDIIFKQRFGDCKDKSLLLCTILNNNNINASVALVNTYIKNYTNRFIPSASVFNHQIVVANIDGVKYWIDPTINLQRGEIDVLSTPDYGKALIVDPQTKNLCDMPEQSLGKSDIEETYHIYDLKDSAFLKVESKYYKNFAENIRTSFASNSFSQIEKSYIDFYINLYKNVKINIQDSLKYEDHEEDNYVEVYEKYKLKGLWTNDTSKNILSATFIATILSEHIKLLPDKIRKIPVALEYPYDLNYTVKIFLPKQWELTEIEKKIERDEYIFFFRSSYDRFENAITYQYTYKILKDHVPVDKISQFIKDMNEIDAVSSHILTWGNEPDRPISKVNWDMIVYIIILSSLFIYFGYRLYKYSLPVSFDYNHAEGIGGWLVLVGIGIVLSPFLIVISSISEGYFNLTSWKNIQNLNIENKFLFQLTWIFEITTNTLLFYFSILINLLYFKRRNTLPQLIIWFYSFNLLIQCLDLYLIWKVNEISSQNWQAFFKTLIGAIIWIPYFSLSLRVKETFVYPYQSPKNSITKEQEEVQQND